MTEVEFDQHREQFRALARFLERAAAGGLMTTFSIYALAALVLFEAHAIAAAIIATLGLLLFHILWPVTFAIMARRFEHQPGFGLAMALLRRDRGRHGIHEVVRELNTYTRRRP